MKTELVSEGAQVDRIDKYFLVGDEISSKIESICHVAMTICIGGEDEGAVEATVEAIRKFHDPVQVE